MRITGENEDCAIIVHTAKVFDGNGKLVFILEQQANGEVWTNTSSVRDHKQLDK